MSDRQALDKQIGCESGLLLWRSKDSKRQKFWVVLFLRYVKAARSTTRLVEQR